MKKRYLSLSVLSLMILPMFCGAVPEATSMDTPAQNITSDSSTNQQQPPQAVKTLADVESENNQATIDNSSKTQSKKEEISNIDDAANGLTS
ncbi:hypothetical protein BZ13_1893 [Francisella philomiragia subsp. philomiragia ATCC 25015]|uniref:hypothetical protein n=1 Tax=Francisella philomiragia TaxID=28110 RepID=UPI0001AF7DF9|nr:hypothetical protein [Francisella philomiragia]AJI75582.1 hypothetical protein BZ13_1893 [Francisella philomiragia subsp. philomiragia ATCC 25015]EET21800.1 predicted protein [Francisella philomiragia subsp. philomiragia ATCC 25015]MBK2238970.1 hypothetical protein [Francisella philomiragia]